MANLWYPEEVRKAKAEKFYKENPDKIACFECVNEIPDDQAKQSSKVSGLMLCGVCLTLILARKT